MKLIDTHTHLYAEEFETDRRAVIMRSLELGINKFFLPAIDSSYTDAMIKTKTLFPENIFLMAGLHPCSVKENYKEELQKVETFMESNDFAGIGESGLDFYWDTKFKKEQIESLHQHIEWSINRNKPLILHTRDAMQDTINVVAGYRNSRLKGIFHCFGGTEKEAEEIISIGFYLGIGGVLTFKNSGLDKVVSKIGLEHLVLETDSPYLAPAPYRGKRNESSYLKIIAEKLAEVKKCTIDEVAQVTTENAEKIFAGYLS